MADDKDKIIESLEKTIDRLVPSCCRLFPTYHTDWCDSHNSHWDDDWRHCDKVRDQWKKIDK